MALLPDLDMTKVLVYHNLDDSTDVGGKTQSLDLAEYYAAARGIPVGNLRGIHLQDVTSNAQYPGTPEQFAEILSSIKADVETAEADAVILSSRCPLGIESTLLYPPVSDPYYYYSFSQCIRHLFQPPSKFRKPIWQMTSQDSLDLGWRYSKGVTNVYRPHTPYAYTGAVKQLLVGHLGCHPFRTDLHNRNKEIIDEAVLAESTGGIPVTAPATIYYAIHGGGTFPVQNEVPAIEALREKYTLKLGWPTSSNAAMSALGYSTPDFLLTRSTQALLDTDGICNINPAGNDTEVLCTAAGGTWYSLGSLARIDAGDTGKEGAEAELDPTLGTTFTNVSAFLGNWYRNRAYIDLFDWMPGSIAWVGTSFGFYFGWGALEHGACCFAGSLAEPFWNPGVCGDAWWVKPKYTGFRMVELATLASNMWQDCIAGDPLYRAVHVRDPIGSSGGYVLRH